MGVNEVNGEDGNTVIGKILRYQQGIYRALWKAILKLYFQLLSLCLEVVALFPNKKTVSFAIISSFVVLFYV